MADVFRNTGLGFLLGIKSPKEKPELKSSPSWWWRSQNHALSLKLESARIPAPSRYEHKDPVDIEKAALSKESLSTMSVGSDDTGTVTKRLAAAENELGWDGLDDPEVCVMLNIGKVWVQDREKSADCRRTH